MNNRIFKNKKHMFAKLEKVFWQLWEKSFIRFIVIGGFNTLLGIIVVNLLRWLFENVFFINAKWVFTIWFLTLEIDIPGVIMFVGLLPVAYTTQALWAFRSRWTLKRLAIYPLSSLPNFVMQQGFIYLFETVLGVPYWYSYVLATILPIPVMFFIIGFLVSNKNDRNRLEENKEQSSTDT
jgi:putative flippase GtrA